jgi:hypothetical protein
MAKAACPKCQTIVPIIPGEQPVCPGCGQRFKGSRKAELTAPQPTLPPIEPPLPQPADEFIPDAYLSPAPMQLPVAVAPAPAAAPVITFPQAMSVVPERTSIIAKVIWFLFIGFAGAVLLFHLTTQAEHREMNAIQQASLGVETCVWIIFGYVVCRAIDAITRH